MKKIVFFALLFVSINLFVTNVSAGDIGRCRYELTDNVDGLSENIIFDETSENISDLQIDIRKKVKVLGVDYEFICVEETEGITYNDVSYPTYYLIYKSTVKKEIINNYSAIDIESGGVEGVEYSYSTSSEENTYWNVEGAISIGKESSASSFQIGFKAAYENGNLSSLTDNYSIQMTINNMGIDTTYHIYEYCCYDEYLCFTLNPECIKEKYNVINALFTLRWDHIGKSYVTDVVYPINQFNTYTKIVYAYKTYDIEY